MAGNSFKFTSPDGQPYVVHGPEGATQEQAFGILQQQLASAGPKPGSVPGSEGALPADRNVAQPGPGALDVLAGAPEAAVAMGQAGLAGLAGRGVSLAGKALGGTGEAGVKLAERMRPNVSPRAGVTLDALSGVLEPLKLEGLGPMFAPELAATPAGPAGRTAGKVLAPEAEGLKRLPGKVADLVTPKPSPEIAALAKKAADMGIELRPDMLANNRIAKFIGEALEQVPLSGSKAEQRQIAFNGALTKIIGGDNRSKRLTPDVFDRAMTTSGEKIGQISKETPIPVGPDFKQALDTRVADVTKFETSDVARIVSNYVKELEGAAEKNGGIIPGETFRKINSKIGAQGRRSEGDLKNALYDLQEDMHSALEANIKSPERLAELKEARYKYAMGKILEPLVAKAKGGDISPAGLMAAVTSSGDKKTTMARGRGGDIGDLARIGQAFLKEPPSSGTAERALGYGLLGGGAFAEPHTAAGLVGAANLYNRLGPALTKRAINRRSVDPVATQPWNTGIIDQLSK